MLYSYKVIPSLKGSAFVASTMLACQKSPLDHLMYYDARINTGWNGLFDYLSQTPLKPYWGLHGFSRLYLLGNEVKNNSDDPAVYCGAAVSDDGRSAAILVSTYTDHDSIDGSGCEDEVRDVRIRWSGFSSSDGVRVAYTLTDADHDAQIVSEETFFGVDGAHILRLPLYSTVLVTLTKV